MNARFSDLNNIENNNLENNDINDYEIEYYHQEENDNINYNYKNFDEINELEEEQDYMLAENEEENESVKNEQNLFNCTL